MRSNRVVVRVLVAALFVLFMGGMWFWMFSRLGMAPWGPERAMWGGIFPLWGLPMILFLVFFVGGLARWLFWGAHPGPMWFESHPRGQTPLDILAKRYASGEIAKEQYEEMKRELSV